MRRVVKIFIGLGVIVLLIGLGLTIYQLSRLYQANAAWSVRVADLEQRNSELSKQAESDFYRGVMSSCIGIGMQMSMPREMVAATCQAYWLTAYRNDWYSELAVETWQFPPVERQKKSAAP